MSADKRDVISDLPDELICHILSFLPTKVAASTSVLAKRWMHLLAFVPNLDFDDSFYFHPPLKPLFYNKRRKNSSRFTRFVDSVLALQATANAPLNRFHVKCKDVDCEYYVFDWIPKVLKRGVLDIDVYISLVSCFCNRWSYCDMPSKIFVSKTLVRLKIKFADGFNINVEGDVCLPKLKTLHLENFQIKTSMFNKLLSGCNVLEELVLIDLVWYWEEEPEPCSVSNPTLKRLKFCRPEGYDEESTLSLSFDIPNLVYLEYVDNIAGKYPSMSFDSLVEARLRLGKARYQTETDKINATNLIMGIHKVKILYFDTLKALACWREIIPVFYNVIQLTIKTTPDINWDPLPTLLKNCPNLETLVFEGLHHIYTNRCEDEDGCLCKYQDDWGKNMDIRTCLSSSPVKVLKILKFGETFGEDDDYDDNDDEDAIEKQIEQVKHFLETMPNLEQMILYYNTPNNENVMEVFKKLQELPRVASAKCSVQIISANLNLSLTKRASEASQNGVILTKNIKGKQKMGQEEMKQSTKQMTKKMDHEQKPPTRQIPPSQQRSSVTQNKSRGTLSHGTEIPLSNRFTALEQEITANLSLSLTKRDDDDDDDDDDDNVVDDDLEEIEKQRELVKHFPETMPDLEQLYKNTPHDEDVMKVSKKHQELPRVANLSLSSRKSYSRFKVTTNLLLSFVFSLFTLIFLFYFPQ